jgi:glycosyltransferase involved in cell wall biosynthesis
MNILLLTNDLRYSGAARQLTLLAAGLPRERFAVSVFTLGPDAPWSRALREGGLAVDRGERRRLFDLKPFMRLRRALRGAAPAVIHVLGLAALRALALACGRRGGRVVLSALGPAERLARLGVIERGLLAGLVDRVAARGPAEAEHYRHLGVPARKIVEVPPGVPEAAPPKQSHADLCRELGLPANARLIVGLGPLEPAKGFRDVIWAFDILRFLYDDLHFLFVGAGSQEPRLREFAALTQTTGRVHFLGERGDLDEVLGHAEVVWVPSRADRGTGAALEAMAAGRPVVAARWPGLAEVIVDGVTGVLVETGDKGALARETRRLLDDPERRRQMGEAGRVRAVERFCVDAMVRRYEALYAAIAAGSG